MKQILSFSLFEANRHPHFKKRIEQRILNLQEVNLNPRIELDLEEEIGPDWKGLLIDSIIKNTESRIFKAVEATEYKYNHNFAVPISSLYLVYNGKKSPIVITASTVPGEKSYSGSQIWISVRQNEAITIKVFPKDKDTDYISRNMEEGISDIYKENKYELIRPKGDFESLFEWDPNKGRFITDEEEEEKNLIPVSKSTEERKTIGPGDKIGLMVKSISENVFTIGSVTEIINIGEIKDKQKTGDLEKIEGIKVGFLPMDKSQRIIIDGEEKAFRITIKSGSKILIDGEEYSVLGPEGGRPLVTSEPEIINKNRAQTWVQRP
jgi:hypothetical protein